LAVGLFSLKEEKPHPGFVPRAHYTARRRGAEGGETIDFPSNFFTLPRVSEVLETCVGTGIWNLVDSGKAPETNPSAAFRDVNSQEVLSMVGRIPSGFAALQASGPSLL